VSYSGALQILRWLIDWLISCECQAKRFLPCYIVYHSCTQMHACSYEQLQQCFWFECAYFCICRASLFIYLRVSVERDIILITFIYSNGQSSNSETYCSKHRYGLLGWKNDGSWALWNIDHSCNTDDYLNFESVMFTDDHCIICMCFNAAFVHMILIMTMMVMMMVMIGRYVSWHPDRSNLLSLPTVLGFLVMFFIQCKICIKIY